MTAMTHGLIQRQELKALPIVLTRKFKTMERRTCTSNQEMHVSVTTISQHKVTITKGKKANKY